jgi:hypothetical protein
MTAAMDKMAPIEAARLISTVRICSAPAFCGRKSLKMDDLVRAREVIAANEV